MAHVHTKVFSKNQTHAWCKKIKILKMDKNLNCNQVWENHPCPYKFSSEEDSLILILIIDSP